MPQQKRAPNQPIITDEDHEDSDVPATTPPPLKRGESSRTLQRNQSPQGLNFYIIFLLLFHNTHCIYFFCFFLM